MRVTFPLCLDLFNYFSDRMLGQEQPSEKGLLLAYLFVVV